MSRAPTSDTVAAYQKLVATYQELGLRRYQVYLLREALKHYGQHADYCRSSSLCNCAFGDALTIASDMATMDAVLRTGTR